MRNLWKVLVRHRDYRYLLTASLVSMTGDWILMIGLAYYVYALTGSTIASGSVLLAAIAPQMLLGSVAGVFVDRWDRRRTMLGANLLLAIGLLPLLAVQGESHLWIVYPVLVFSTCVEQFFVPAEQAMVPLLVPEDDLITANALNGQNRNLARLVGAALGGVAANAGGIALVAAVDAGTFLLAAALIAAIKTRTSRPAKPPDAEPSSLRQEWRDGLELASRQPVLRVVFTVIAVTALGEGIMGTLFAPYVRDDLDGSGGDYGAILSAQAVGGIIAGFMAAVIGHRFSARSLFGWGAFWFGVIDLMLFLYPLIDDPLWPAFVLIGVVGLPGAVMIAGMTTLLQTSSSDLHRGRVFGAMGTIQGTTMLGGVLLAGVLGELVGIMPILALQGAMYVLAGVFILLAMPRTSATLVRPADETG